MSDRHCMFSLGTGLWAIEPGALSVLRSTQVTITGDLAERARAQEWYPSVVIAETFAGPVHERELAVIEARGESRDSFSTTPLVAFRTRKTNKAIAVLPVRGIMTRHPNLATMIFGGTPMQLFGQAFDALVANPSIGGIVFDMDTPGGTFDGAPELAAKVFSARGSKPIVAVANGCACSGGYYLASAADQFVVSPSGETGSIGVVAIHENISKQLETDGREIEIITAGEHKFERNEFEPLSETARAGVRELVDRQYAEFTADVAKHRGVTPRQVRSGFGQGRVLGAKAAVEEGLANGIATLEEVLAKMGGTIADQSAALVQATERVDHLAALTAGVGRCSAVAFAGTVPPDPSGGSGEGIEGEWSKPGLGDFTDQQWDDLTGQARAAIGRHFAWYDNLNEFGALKLPHHFADSGRASLAGVRNALARLNQVQGLGEDSGAVEAHLRAHLSED